MGNSVRLVAAACAVVMAGLLSGCIAGPAPVPSETSEPQPSQSPTPEPLADRPTPRNSISCNSVISPNAAATFLAPDAEYVRLGLDQTLGSPAFVALANHGAVLCTWENMPPPAWWETTVDYRGAHLWIVPATDEQWQKYGQIDYDTGETIASGASVRRCLHIDGSWDENYCELSGRENGYWYDFRGSGVADNAVLGEEELLQLIAPIHDGIIAALNAEPALVERWRPLQAPQAVLPECEGILSVEQAEELTGASIRGVGPGWDGPRRGPRVLALFDLGYHQCDALLTNVESSAVRVSVVEAGAWAAREVLTAQIAAGNASPTEVVGLATGDTAAFSCTDVLADCVVTLSHKGNWVEIRVPMLPRSGEPGLYDPDTAQARDNIAEIAATVLANLDANAG